MRSHGGPELSSATAATFLKVENQQEKRGKLPVSLSDRLLVQLEQLIFCRLIF